MNSPKSFTNPVCESRRTRSESWQAQRRSSMTESRTSSVKTLSHTLSLARRSGVCLRFSHLAAVVALHYQKHRRGQSIFWNPLSELLKSPSPLPYRRSHLPSKHSRWLQHRAAAHPSLHRALERTFVCSFVFTLQPSAAVTRGVPSTAARWATASTSTTWSASCATAATRWRGRRAPSVRPTGSGATRLQRVKVG